MRIAPKTFRPLQNQRELYDHKRDTQGWHRWYKLQRWVKRRARQLRRQSLCIHCLEEGRSVAATIADHVVPHRGDPDKFWHGELQSMCVMHHNRKTRQGG